MFCGYIIQYDIIMIFTNEADNKLLAVHIEEIIPIWRPPGVPYVEGTQLYEDNTTESEFAAYLGHKQYLCPVFFGKVSGCMFVCRAPDRDTETYKDRPTPTNRRGPHGVVRHPGRKTNVITKQDRRAKPKHMGSIGCVKK